jgi:hypothetical protein
MAAAIDHRAIVTSKAAGLPLVGLADSPRSHQLVKAYYTFALPKRANKFAEKE